MDLLKPLTFVASATDSGALAPHFESTIVITVITTADRALFTDSGPDFDFNRCRRHLFAG
jgi:hypothetical protein